MGADSTAVLLRWLTEPGSRDFGLDDLVVVVAQLGSEFARTYELCEAHVLPRLAEAGVRLVQASRGGPRRADGVAILSDSRRPERLVRAGPWRLVDELRAAGTVPQVAHGRRLCTHKHKGWVLDQVVGLVVGGSAYRHVIGYNADELRRAERDGGYGGAGRAASYPLIEWGWGRSKVEAYVEGLVGEPWMKSRCGFCPFSACAGSRDRHLADWAGEPERGVEALLLEASALALNPRMALYGGRRAIDLAREAGLGEVLRRFGEALEATEWSLYRVRRIWWPRREAVPTLFGGTTQRGQAWRSTEVLESGRREAVEAALRRAARRSGGAVEADGPTLRCVLRAAGAACPTTEESLVTAPAGVEAKARPGFDAAWEALGKPGASAVGP